MTLPRPPPHHLAPPRLPRPLGLTGLLFFEAYYFAYLRSFWASSNKADGYPTIENWARTLGQMANCLLGLLVLPVSRNSFFVTMFGVPWEAAIYWHVKLGQVRLRFPTRSQ